jgi:hypothetical protein
MRRTMRNVVALPARPGADTVTVGESASIIDAEIEKRLLDAAAAIILREIDLQLELAETRQRRRALTRRINRLPPGPRPSIDEAGSPR